MGTTRGDHTWGPHLETTLGDHTWGPHLGITLGDHTWGSHLGTTHFTGMSEYTKHMILNNMQVFYIYKKKYTPLVYSTIYPFLVF